MAEQKRSVLLIAGSNSWRDWVDDFVRPNDVDVQVLYEPVSLEAVLDHARQEQHGSIVFLSHHDTLTKDALWAGWLKESFAGTIVVQPPNVAALAYDKREMANLAALQSVVLPIPELTLSEASDALRRNHPVVVKPLTGTEGNGFHVVFESEELATAAAAVPNGIIQPFIVGHEYSLNFLRVGRETVIYPLVDKGMNSVDGIHPSKRIRLCPSPLLDPLREESMRTAASFIAEAASMDGLCEIEFLATDDQIYLVEINPRVSATMRMSSLACGVSIFEQLIYLSLGDQLGQGVLPASRCSTEFPVPKDLVGTVRKGRFAPDVWVTSRVTIVADEMTSLKLRTEQIQQLFRDNPSVQP